MGNEQNIGGVRVWVDRNTPTPGRADVTIQNTDELTTLRTQLATANDENARLGRELEEAREKCTALVKECDNYELRLGQMARAQAKPQHDAMLAAMDKATDTLEAALRAQADAPTKEAHGAD